MSGDQPRPLVPGVRSYSEAIRNKNPAPKRQKGDNDCHQNWERRHENHAQQAKPSSLMVPSSSPIRDSRYKGKDDENLHTSPARNDNNKEFKEVVVSSDTDVDNDEDDTSNMDNQEQADEVLEHDQPDEGNVEQAEEEQSRSECADQEFPVVQRQEDDGPSNFSAKSDQSVTASSQKTVTEANASGAGDATKTVRKTRVDQARRTAQRLRDRQHHKERSPSQSSIRDSFRRVLSEERAQDHANMGRPATRAATGSTSNTR